jgi:FMN phosphatase YigB (HAD superfamily)
MKSITRLVIMDFDGTLMDTMTPDIGKPLWEDRPEHTKVFSEWAEIVKKYGIECKVNQV